MQVQHQNAEYTNRNPFKPGATTTLSNGLLGWRSLSVTEYYVQTASSINQKTQAVNYSKQIQTEVRNMLHLNKGVPSCNVKGILFSHTICALYIVNVVKIFRYILYVCK